MSGAFATYAKQYVPALAFLNLYGQYDVAGMGPLVTGAAAGAVAALASAKYPSQLSAVLGVVNKPLVKSAMMYGGSVGVLAVVMGYNPLYGFVLGTGVGYYMSGAWFPQLFGG